MHTRIFLRAFIEIQSSLSLSNSACFQTLQENKPVTLEVSFLLYYLAMLATIYLLKFSFSMLICWELIELSVVCLLVNWIMEQKTLTLHYKQVL